MEGTPKLAAAALGAGRAAFGAAMLIHPRPIAAKWLGARNADLPVSSPAMRFVGGREVAIGTAMCIAALTGRSPEMWLAAATVGDVTDLIATLTGPLPEGTGVVTAAAALPPALAQIALLVIAHDD